MDNININFNKFYVKKNDLNNNKFKIYFFKFVINYWTNSIQKI